MGFLGSLIYQNKTDISAIAGDGGNTGIHPYIIIHGDVIVTGGSNGAVCLAKIRIQETMHIGSMQIVLLYQKIGRLLWQTIFGK